MTVPLFNKVLILLQIFNTVVKISAILLNLHEVAEKNVKADGQVLKVFCKIGFIMCSRKCAASSSCRGINFNKPHLKCELLSASVTATRPAQDWWYVDNMEWLKQKNLAHQMEDKQCALREKKVVLSSGILHCVQIENDQTSTKFRLMGSSEPYKGRVEVFYGGSWGTICDDFFDKHAANVVCKMFGYTDGGIPVSAYSNFGVVASNTVIWMDDVRCHGNEVSIEFCQFNNWGDNDCSHYEDVGVICANC